MNALAFTLSLPRRSRVVTMFTEWFAGIQDGLRIARRYEQLRAMSDAELAAIGLARHEIAAAAVRSVR